MGAGARLAEERDRWAAQWRLADLDQEGDHLLEGLTPGEELRAAVPGTRTIDGGGEVAVLIGVTDRRVLVVGRRRSRELGEDVGVEDATGVVTALAAAGTLTGVLTGFASGTVALDPDSAARLTEHVGEPGGATGVW